MNGELRTYIALAGNQRLPHLEEEIFADRTLLLQYLLQLCGYPNDTTGPQYSPFLCYYYATHIMYDRWPVAESIINSSGMYRAAYTRFIKQKYNIELT